MIASVCGCIQFSYCKRLIGYNQLVVDPVDIR